tara:strand:+ start:3484 stop:9660 length:6177 start_codon:yes stop_codon:yes gene_type:complete
MSCRVQNGKAILRSGKESELFKSLVLATGNIDEATNLYEQVHSKNFTDWYSNWEKNYTPNLFSDENGEPKLVSENGFYSFKNGKGDTWEIALEIKDKSNALNIDREAQADLINTLVGFITKVRGENPNIFKDDKQVERYFGLGKDSKFKGALANKMLMEAFPGATSEQAQELYNILNTQGAEAMFNALPDNVTLNEAGTDEYVAWEVFTGAYARWNSQINDVTGNIERVGVRELLKDALTDYGFRLRDREGEMNEFEDTPERIYSMSSFQEDPRTKLSSEAKAIIGNIQLEESNIFGYSKLLPISKAYAIVAEATVGEPTYQEMLSKLAFYAQYKPEARIILNKLQSAEITAKDEAALFTNFKSAYNNFILFKSEGYTNEETGVVTYENKIFNSNQSQISKKEKERFRENSRERTLINPRAIYKVDPFTGNIIEIKEGVIDKLEKLWTQIDNVKQRKQGVYDTEDINALGEYIWTLGMELGPTLETTQQNLQTYYNNGNEEGDAGVVLFDELVSTPQESFQNFLLALKDGQDIYQTYSSLVNKITEIAPLFNNQPFGSFISGTGKQYYPINLPSRLNELMSSINNPKESGKTIEILNQFLNGPLFRPYGSVKYSSRLVSILHSDPNARKNFIHEVLDSYKAADEFVATTDYDNQSSKISLIERLMGFMNNGNKNFTRIAIPIQAGRESLDFITIPRLTPGVNRTDLIRSIIIQDLARIDQANEAIMDAFRKQNPSDLIEGYHYLNPADRYAADGSAFTMTQISGLGNPLLKDGSEMSDYTKAYATGVDFLQKDEFEQLLNTKISEVSERLTVYEKRLQDRLKTYNIELLKDVSKDLNTSTKKINFLNAFVFENFIGKIEISKVLRSGFSFAKNTEGFYKRMALLKTPGNKLFLKGMSEKDSNYGMPETYNAVTIRDFDFVDKGRAIEVAENLERILIGQGVSKDEAEEIAAGYTSVNKSDAQSFISLTMYRGIMQGMGQWENKDEEAYKNAMDPEVGLYIDEDQRPRPIYPLKPFHEEISLQGGVNALFMDKNSYTVVTPELAASYSYLQSMLAAMNKGIDVVNTESATKGARVNIQDFQTIGNLDAATPIAMDSNMLRFPQMIPRTKKTDIAFNRQIRKNLVANIQPLGEYTVGNRKMLGSELIKIYQETVAANIAEDTKNINNALGITGLEKLRGKEGTKEYRDVKLKYLKQVRDKIAEQIKERDLPDNYLDALSIVPNGAFDWQFKIPLSFPNYQAKFEGIFMSMFHNELFNQKLKGQELVQVAELGGHVISGELEFYDGSNPAQIRVKASTLGLPPGTNPADIDPARLQVVGYRIPQQGKNSSLFMQVVDFLPESHEKAIMVPGGITLQQGSDFDVDKLNLIFPELDAEGNVIKPDYNKDPVDMDRLERNNVIFNVFNSILMDPKHLKEVVKPLDNNSIKNAREFLADKINLDSTIDYNDPMAELDMEERAKLGSALIGLWSNHLAGRNVAETVKVLEIKASYAPIIDDKTYAALGVTTDSDGNFTDSNISEHLSSAVDYANDPIQLSVNDNIYTNPVLGMFYNAGIPIRTALNFVNQPIIREVTKYASDNALSIGKLDEAIEFVNKKYGIGNIKAENVVAMDSNQMLNNLTEPEPGVQAQYLANFNKFFMAGRALQTVNKIITPDNLDNVTELSSIAAWLDTENLYLNNPESLIQNAEEIIQHHKTIKESLSPIASAYRGIFNTIIKETDRIGFLNNKPAFVNFKDELKEALGQSKLTDAQHKLVDRALFLKLITRPHSPFVDNGPINEENFNSMYVNPTNNLITRLQNIREAYPELNNNLFVQALEADPSNKETMLFLLRLNVPMGVSTTDKNELSKALLELVESKNEDIRNFGKLLVTNQILTSGFSPTFGSYIDLIPSKVLTTNILNPSKQSPVQYFKQEAEELMRTNYFDDFVHDFVRTYGLQRPKGVPIVKRINKKLSVDKDGFTTFGLSTPDIYSENGVTLDYFLASYEGKSAIFVHVEGGKYQLLSLLGRSRKLNESGVGPSNSPSLVNSQGTTNKPGPRKIQPVDVITINEDTAVVRTLDNTDCL